MIQSPTLVTNICTVAVALVWIPFAVVSTYVRFRMADAEHWMRKQGIYSTWAADNKQLIRLNRASIFGFIGSFFGLMVFLALSNPYPAFDTLAMAALLVMILMLVTAFISHWLLYRKMVEKLE